MVIKLMQSDNCLNTMETPVVFFDNYCVLCSRSVQFIFRHDKDARFRFSDFESEAFKSIIPQLPDPGNIPDTVILYEHGKVYMRSSAALRIAARLRFPVNLFSIFFIVPPFIRDSIYNLVARFRYRWFGRRATCFIPDPELKNRFIS